MQKDKKKTVALILPECSSLCGWENRVPQKIDDELKTPTVKNIR